MERRSAELPCDIILNISSVGAAYGTTREAGKPRPAEYALWATAEDYYRRSGDRDGGDSCARTGRLFLGARRPDNAERADGGPPSEIYFEGAGLVRGVA